MIDARDDEADKVEDIYVPGYPHNIGEDKCRHQPYGTSGTIEEVDGSTALLELNCSLGQEGSPVMSFKGEILAVYSSPTEDNDSDYMCASLITKEVVQWLKNVGY